MKQFFQNLKEYLYTEPPVPLIVRLILIVYLAIVCPVLMAFDMLSFAAVGVGVVLLALEYILSSREQLPVLMSANREMDLPTMPAWYQTFYRDEKKGWEFSQTRLWLSAYRFFIALPGTIAIVLRVATGGDVSYELIAFVTMLVGVALTGDAPKQALNIWRERPVRQFRQNPEIPELSPANQENRRKKRSA